MIKSLCWWSSLVSSSWLSSSFPFSFLFSQVSCLSALPWRGAKGSHPVRWLRSTQTVSRKCERRKGVSDVCVSCIQHWQQHLNWHKKTHHTIWSDTFLQIFVPLCTSHTNEMCSYSERKGERESKISSFSLSTSVTVMWSVNLNDSSHFSWCCVRERKDLSFFSTSFLEERN